MIARDSKGRFLPGNNENPKGRPKEPEELRFLRKSVHIDIKLAALQIMKMSFNEVQELIFSQTGQMSAASRMLLTCYEKAAVDGSPKHFEIFFKVLGFNLSLPVPDDNLISI